MRGEGGEVGVGGERTEGAVIVQQESQPALGTNVAPQAGVKVLQLDWLHLCR